MYILEEARIRNFVVVELIRSAVVTVYDKNGKCKDIQYHDEGETMYFSLNDKESLKISYASGYIKEVKPDWAPTNNLPNNSNKSITHP